MTGAVAQAVVNGAVFAAVLVVMFVLLLIAVRRFGRPEDDYR